MPILPAAPTGAPTLVPIICDDDVIRFRHMVRQAAQATGMRLIDQTKLVTAASELARNTLEHGGGGSMTIEIVENGPRRGVKLTFTDNGPGIPDMDAALSDGFTTGNGMGLGLGGSKRLVNEFKISSEPGRGTTVTIIRWK